MVTRQSTRTGITEDAVEAAVGLVSRAACSLGDSGEESASPEPADFRRVYLTAPAVAATQQGWGVLRSAYVRTVRPGEGQYDLRITGGSALSVLVSSAEDLSVDSLDLNEAWAVTFAGDEIGVRLPRANPPRPEPGDDQLSRARALVAQTVPAAEAVQFSNEYLTARAHLEIYSAYAIVTSSDRVEGACVMATMTLTGVLRLESCSWRRTWYIDTQRRMATYPHGPHPRLTKAPPLPVQALPWQMAPEPGELLLSDREQIVRLHAKYTWCLDQGDDDGLASCFEPDVFTDLAPAPGRVYGREALVRALRTVRADAVLMQHYVANPVVEINGAEATMSAFAFVPRFVPGLVQPVIRGGHYETRLVRSPGGWRFSYFAYHMDFRSDRDH